LQQKRNEFSANQSQKKIVVHKFKILNFKLFFIFILKVTNKSIPCEINVCFCSLFTFFSKDENFLLRNRLIWKLYWSPQCKLNCVILYLFSFPLKQIYSYEITCCNNNNKSTYQNRVFPEVLAGIKLFKIFPVTFATSNVRPQISSLGGSVQFTYLHPISWTLRVKLILFFYYIVACFLGNAISNSWLLDLITIYLDFHQAELQTSIRYTTLRHIN
jgi:hypothetical protein